MGMDVHGKKPTTEAGKYFRNNVWWWRPLAEYVCAVAPTIAGHCTYWHSNDGDGLNAQYSKALAAKLREEVASGRTAIFAQEYARDIQALPWKECWLCNGTGIRNDDIGRSHGFPDKIVDTTDALHPRAGQKGWCNGCNGVGKHEPDAAHYPFSVENVQEFIEFLEGCGGFEIW